MYSEKAKLYGFLLLVSDVVSITAAFFIAYWLRAVAVSSLIGPLYPLSRYTWLLGVALITWPLIFKFFALYEVQVTLDTRGRAFFKMAIRLLQGLFLGGLTLSLLLFVFRLYYTSRLLAFVFGAISYALLIAGRLLVHRFYVRSGNETSILNLLVVGTNPRAQRLAQSVAASAHLGARVLGFIAESEEAPRGPIDGLHILGTIRDLPRIVSQCVVDQVIVSVPSEQLQEMRTVFYLCEEQGINVSLVLDVLPSHHAGIRLGKFEDAALISLANAPSDDTLLAAKRILDVVLSSCLLVLSLPVFLVIPVTIKLTSRGPVFFRQTRVGLHGRRFTLLKFRSMIEEAEVKKRDLESLNEAEEPIFKIAEDPRVTSIGRVLRRTSLDEIPQFFNVLRGDMSLVGPRPPVPEEVERYRPAQRRRLSVKPGLTGLWQVRGRSGLSFEEYVNLDLYYIDNWSLLLDLKILARTVPAVLVGRGAH